MGEVAAFDVYETLLFRVVGHYSSSHLLLGRAALHRGLSTHDAVVMAVARQQAEARARRRAAGAEIRLSDIHQELADSFGYASTRASEMSDLELEIEARTTRSTPTSRKLVASARRSGGRIVFISDTYLSEAFVRSMLERSALLLPGDGLYVSSQHGVTKRSRLLFRKVIESEGVRARAIIHTGNSWTADVRSARDVGVVAHHYPEGNPNRYEEALERWSHATAGLSSMMAGASRLARLGGSPSEDVRAVTLNGVAAGVAGPAVTGFVLWLFNRAQREGIERLYFLAREGQILYEVAKHLCARLDLPIEPRYLYVSRQSLNVAAIEKLNDEELTWALTHSSTNSIRTLLARLGSSPDAIEGELRERGWEPGRWDDPVGTEELPKLLETLTLANVRTQLEEGIAEARSLATSYLEQEGVFDPMPIGLVDTTGVGSQLRAISRLRTARSLPATRGFLMFRKAAHFAPDDAKGTQTFGWFSDETLGVGYGPTPGRAALLEVICAADHGTTLRYERDADRVRPHLSQPTSRATIDWGLPVVRAAVSRFVDELCLDADLIDRFADVRPAINDVMHLLWVSPTRNEAEVWGRFPFESTSGLTDVPAPLANPFTLNEVVAGLAKREMRDRTWFEWSAASEQLSSPLAAGIIKAARFAKHSMRTRRPPQVARNWYASRRWKG